LAQAPTRIVLFVVHFIVIMAMRSLVLLLAASASATDLTKETWDGAVAGKSVFVKFLAPW